MRISSHLLPRDSRQEKIRILARADEIRDELLAKGIVLKDTRGE